MKFNYVTKEFLRIEEECTIERLREFCLTLAAILFFFAWLTFSSLPDKVMVGLGLLLFISGIIKPELMRGAYKMWMNLSIIFGFIMNRLILSIIFYLLLTPIGLILKITRHDLLDLKIKSEVKTYWKTHPDKKFDSKIKKESYSKMYSSL